MATIKDALVDFNPWWKEDFGLDFHRRDVYGRVQRFMPMRQMLVFTGLRRTGKSTILLKAAQDAIRGGMDPKNIIFFSFDEFRDVEIRAILREYEELFGKNLRNGRYLLLLDELQKLPGWDNQLKTIYDVFRNIKIMVSGSESLFLRRKSKETLAGRMFEFTVEPLSFKEFLSFKGADFEPHALYEKELSRLFDEFTRSQGLPELVGVSDKEVIRKYVRESIVEKVLYTDLPQLVPVKDAGVLASLVNLFMEQPGELVQLVELSKELGVSRQTLSDYLAYLEQSFLVKKLYNFSNNRRKMEQKLKKYYPALVSPALAFKEDDFSRSRVFMKRFNAPKGCIISRRLEEKRRVNGKAVEVVPAFKYFLR
ncbi:ATP-binding protein [Candidatus Micrarchaeota archaeon]|nr:ATP-binding protein [Candidatus Micrarchaeota archaeon]